MHSSSVCCLQTGWSHRTGQAGRGICSLLERAKFEISKFHHIMLLTAVQFSWSSCTLINEIEATFPQGDSPTLCFHMIIVPVRRRPWFSLPVGPLHCSGLSWSTSAALKFKRYAWVWGEDHGWATLYTHSCLIRGIVKIQLVLPPNKSWFSSSLPLVCL